MTTARNIDSVLMKKIVAWILPISTTRIVDVPVFEIENQVELACYTRSPLETPMSGREELNRGRHSLREVAALVIGTDIPVSGEQQGAPDQPSLTAEPRLELLRCHRPSR